MASNYNLFERSIAEYLSKNPLLKKKVKYLYQNFVFNFNKKKYKKKHDGLKFLNYSVNEESTFFGYFDKSPVSNDGKWIIYHSVDDDTKKNIQDRDSLCCKIIISSFVDNTILYELENNSFNYQQGSRLMWVDNERFVFNQYDESNDKYVSLLYSINSDQKIKTLNYPICDLYKDKYYVSVDFDKLGELRPDYGYFNRIKNKKYSYSKCCPIKIIDFETDNILDEISLESFSLKVDCQKAKFNHIQISPNGNKFTFMLRYFDSSNIRYDELYVYDFNSSIYKKIPTGRIVSHLCWINNNELFGYLSDENNRNGYYIINTKNGSLKFINQLESLSDGHPTYDAINNIVYFDSYPNKARLQSLYSYDFKGNLEHLAEFYHPLGFEGETRCDLHPRFFLSNQHSYISIDSIYNSKRNLIVLEVE
ncbi:TPA: hypothetical protein ACX6QX_003636 [Photobacterium damselae]